MRRLAGFARTPPPRAQLEAEGVPCLDAYREKLMAGSETPPPDAALAREQLRRLLEQADRRSARDFPHRVRVA